MLALLLGLAGLVCVLTVLFWFGSQALQNFLYTSACEGLYWQAPVAAVVIASLLFAWSLLNDAFARPGTREVTFGYPWEFKTRVDVIDQPVLQFESKRPASEPALFQVDKSRPFEIRYKQKDADEYWTAVGAEYVKFTHNDVEYHFVPDRRRTREEGHIVFVEQSSGLEMSEFEIGRVGYTSHARLVVYLLINVVHLFVWILCFWLLLRFQLRHAVGLGISMWFLFTLAIAPTLFASAALA